MFWAAVVAVFLVPIYYRSRAKGYNAALLTWTAGVVAAIVFMLLAVSDQPFFIIPAVMIPGAFLVAVMLLPKRPGAPGPIAFACPNCHRDIELPHQKAGLTSLCPLCGETLTVPGGTHPSIPVVFRRPRPPATSGLVTYASFDNEVEAERLVNALLDNDIPAQIARENTSGFLPPITWTRLRVVIDVSDWARAVDVERSLHEQDARR